MAKEKINGRFIVKKQKASPFSALSPYVLVDRETGVNYLYVASGYSGGLTVLTDALGKPIVTPVIDEQ